MKCIHCGATGKLLIHEDEQGPYCSRCGMAPSPADEQPQLPDITALIEEANKEQPESEQPTPQPVHDLEDEEQEEIPDDWVTIPKEKKPMVKKVVKKSTTKRSTPATKKTTTKKKGAAAKSKSRGSGAPRGDFLGKIDEILMRELALQKKGEYKKMKTEEQLDAEIDKIAKAAGKQAHANGKLHQGVKAYRSYFNSESKSQGGNRLPSDPFLYSKERILKMVEKGDNVKAKIAEQTKASKAKRKS